MPSSIVSPMRCSKEAATAMTFIESHPSGCSGQKRPAKVVCRIKALRNVRGVAAGGGEGFSTSRGTIHAGPSWLRTLTKEGVHNVHTWGFGFGCTGIGLGRIGEVFGGVAGFQGLAPGSSPTSGTVFSRSRAISPLSVDILCCVAPFGGLFSIGCGRRGRGPPSMLGATVCRSIPVHGRSWIDAHDLGKIWCGFLYRIAACSPGSSFTLFVRLAVRDRGAQRHVVDVRAVARDENVQPSFFRSSTKVIIDLALRVPGHVKLAAWLNRGNQQASPTSRARRGGAAAGSRPR